MSSRNAMKRDDGRVGYEGCFGRIGSRVRVRRLGGVVKSPGELGDTLRVTLRPQGCPWWIVIYQRHSGATITLTRFTVESGVNITPCRSTSLNMEVLAPSSGSDSFNNRYDSLRRRSLTLPDVESTSLSLDNEANLPTSIEPSECVLWERTDMGHAKRAPARPAISLFRCLNSVCESHPALLDPLCFIPPSRITKYPHT